MLYALPAWVVLFFAIVVFAAAACGGLLLVRRVFPRVDFQAHNSVVGVFSGVVGGLFTVTVAFIIVIVWQEMDGTSQRVAGEVAGARDLWHIAAGFPTPMRLELRSRLVKYAHLMVDQEWPAMRSGGESLRAEVDLNRVFEDVAALRPADGGQANAQAAALQYLGALHDARQHRLDDNMRGLSPYEWVTLLLGGCAVVGFCYMVGLPNLRAHLVMIGLVAAIIASTFVLIFELDYPFRGDLAVPSDLWRAFVTEHPAAL